MRGAYGLVELCKAALIYFAAVFGAGFVLGTIRVLLIVPLIGVRAAELSEMPLMLVVIVFAARWVTGRFCREFGASKLLGAGLLAVMLVLVADVIVGVGLRKMTLVQVFTERDAVSGPVYYLLLVIFAVAPGCVGRLRDSKRNSGKVH